MIIGELTAMTKGYEMKKYAFLLSAALLAGCVTSGREVTEKDMSDFEKGKTTSSQVVARLGTPTTTTTSSDGGRVMIYSFVHAQARPESFIPIVGAFVGGADTRSTIVSFIFDSSGIMKDYTQSQSQIGSGQNLSAGAYQAPNREYPKESTQR